MEYGRGTRGYAALKLREQGYKTVTSHIMYCTDLRSTCIYNTRGMSNMQLKGGPHGAWAGACRTSSGSLPLAHNAQHSLVINPRRMRSEGYSSRSVCLSVCLFVCQQLFSHYRLRGGL